MDSLYFLKKLYRTSKSAVIILDTTETNFWSTNLNLISTTPEEIQSDKAIEFFGVKPTDLYPCEGIATIHGTQYTYNVKTYSDRTFEFIIIELRTKSSTTDFVNSNTITKLAESTACAVKKNTANITSIVDNCYGNKSRINVSDYNSILCSVKQILNTTKTITNLKEIQSQPRLTFTDKIDFSDVVTEFANECNNVLGSKNIKANIDCLETIYGYIHESIIYNLCIAMLNRLLAMSGGYVSEITVGLQMFSDDISELGIELTCSDNQCRVENVDALNDIKNRGCVFGSDLFFMKEFCEHFHCEAVQRVNEDEHRYAISIKIPRCEADGILLFKCDDVKPAYVNRFSKLAVGISEIYSLLK